jgi:hypothetical protein
VIVEDLSPLVERLVGGENDGSLAQVSVVDDMEEHVGRIGPVAEIAQLVDDQDVWVSVCRERFV